MYQNMYMDESFEWDHKKNDINVYKHGISFFEAQQAFLDPKRIIAEDLEHSTSEKRYNFLVRLMMELCLFALLTKIKKSAFLMLVIGEKGEKFMKKRKVKYSDEPIGEIKIIDDFLPELEDLVLKEETSKVTLFLTKSSISFFKKEAAKRHTHYQTMIRALVDQYTSHYRKHP